jgi:hypothetical protein
MFWPPLAQRMARCFHCGQSPGAALHATLWHDTCNGYLLSQGSMPSTKTLHATIRTKQVRFLNKNNRTMRFIH